MKLAILTNILTPYRIPLFEAVARRVSELSVLLMTEREENRSWELSKYQFNTQVLSGIHVKPPWRDVSIHLNYGVIGRLRRLDPDIVLSGGFGLANGLALIYCQWYRKAYVAWGEISTRDCGSGLSLRRTIRRVMTSGSRGVVASSSDAREAFCSYGAKSETAFLSVMPIEVKALSTKVASFRASKECSVLKASYHGPILLSVGQIIERKGYQELFAMYERVLDRRRNVNLLVVGDGADRQHYQALAQQRGWTQVHFLGFQQSDALLKYYAIADVFVFHTLFDPFGAVLSEAMAAGVPVVSSIHAGATDDLIDDEAAGFKIDPRHAQQSAERILQILDFDDESRRRMNAAAFRSVSRFDIEPSADALVGFLRSLQNR